MPFVSDFRIKWIITHMITFMIATTLGLVLGKLLAELFFVFIFPFLFVVLSVEVLILRQDLEWANDWFKQSAIGFVIGSILALIQIFALLSVVDLIINHTISLFVIAGTTLIFQYKAISNNYDSTNARQFVIMTLVSLILGSIIVSIIDFIIGLPLEDLVVAISDYSTLLSWSAIGLIYGLFYGILTASVFNNILKTSK